VEVKMPRTLVLATLAALVGCAATPPNDETNCDGVADVIVRITDAAGEVHELVSNGAGNVSTTEPIPGPYTAEVERDGVVVAMATPQTDGSCNACHTAGGSPGRVVAP
jgi:hypothetical protein